MGPTTVWETSTLSVNPSRGSATCYRCRLPRWTKSILIFLGLAVVARSAVWGAAAASRAGSRRPAW
eukprot:3557312-Lingulodinium_polyedra.AAC.1